MLLGGMCMLRITDGQFGCIRLKVENNDDKGCQVQVRPPSLACCTKNMQLTQDRYVPFGGLHCSSFLLLTTNTVRFTPTGFIVMRATLVRLAAGCRLSVIIITTTM